MKQALVLLCFAMLCLAAGCARWPHGRIGPATAADVADLTGDEASDTPAQLATQRTGSNLASSASPPAPPAEPTATMAVPTPDGELAGVMRELESLGAIDPAQQKQLLADLQQSDPKYWPMITQSFRAALARHQVPPDASDEPSATPRPGSPSSWSQPATGPALVGPSAGPAPRATPAVVAGPPQAPVALPPVATSALAAPLASGQLPGTATVVPLPATTAPPSLTPPALEEPAAPLVGPTSTANILSAAPSANDLDANGHLAAAITALEAELRETPEASTPSLTQRHVQLRMLYFLAGRKQDALRPIAGLSATEHDYWSEQIFALAAWEDRQRESDASRRATVAGEHLRTAAARLGELGLLEVKSLAFCTEVKSFGVYKKFADTKFTAGQEVLLYAELENFRSEQTPKGYHTALRSSYQVLDDRGHIVDEQRFDLTEEYCTNPRRDFFIRYFLYLPQGINPGSYTLQLTIEDTLSHKIGQGSIGLTIGAK